MESLNRYCSCPCLDSSLATSHGYVLHSLKEKWINAVYDQRFVLKHFYVTVFFRRSAWAALCANQIQVSFGPNQLASVRPLSKDDPGTLGQGTLLNLHVTCLIYWLYRGSQVVYHLLWKTGWSTVVVVVNGTPQILNGNFHGDKLVPFPRLFVGGYPSQKARKW